MRYQPNFCNHCGEKIERLAPSLTDSTRFCDVCKHDFLPVRAAPVAFAALMAIFGIFGLGFYLRGNGAKPVNVSSKQFAENPSTAAVKNPANSAAPRNSNVGNVSPNANNRPASSPNPASQLLLPPRSAKPNPSEETVYFCGAATKKGTPCSRRVRGGGRCWQHKGQAALLPDEKLRAG